MKRIILTGFEPFGPYADNPTIESTEFFHGRTIGSCEVVGMVLECTYRGAFAALEQAIDQLQPDAILSTGLASSVQGIRIETVGCNVMCGKYPDANGEEPQGEQLIQGGREFISANSDAIALANLLDREGIPVELSADANGFICNALLYSTNHHIHTQQLNIRNAFIHVPWTTNFADTVELEPGKIMIAQETLHDSIELILRHLSIASH